MHGVALLVGTLAVMVGFVAGILYLVQARRLKRKLPPMSALRLPSLEWLEKVNSRAIVISVLAVGIGFLAGIILNVGDRERAEGLPWSDPVIWSSGLMLAWLVAAAIFNGVYRPARRGRKVAYLTVVSFAFLVLALAVLLLVDTQHSGQKQAVPQVGMARLPVASSGGTGILPVQRMPSRDLAPTRPCWVALASCQCMTSLDTQTALAGHHCHPSMRPSILGGRS